MKKYSSSRMFIEYILIAFCSYLLISLIISIISGYGYKGVLCSPYQMYSLIFLYWWIPLFRIHDMDNYITNNVNEVKKPFKGEYSLYMTDDMYLPILYKGIKIEQPFYPGDGELSVLSLEDLCNKYKEYVHQQSVIKQNCMKHIVKLKFGYEFPPNEE